MISRSLGPEFGGAIGIMFTIANSIAVSMYLIGFCDALLDMLAEYISDWGGITGIEEADRLVSILSLALVPVLNSAYDFQVERHPNHWIRNAGAHLGLGRGRDGLGDQSPNAAPGLADRLSTRFHRRLLHAEGGGEEIWICRIQP